MKDKIRKLLALASDPNAAPGERDNASRMAAKLMAKHDIDLSQLREDELRAEFDLTTGEAPGCRPGKKNATEVPTWIGIIAWGVKVYTRTRATHGRGVVYFKGPREDVELAQWLHTTLIQGCYNSSKGRSQTDAAAYRGGYAAALQQRLKAMAKDRDTEDTQTGALVIFQGTRDKLMDEAFGAEGGSRKSKVNQSEEGRSAGMNAAIPTGRPIRPSVLRITQ